VEENCSKNGVELLDGGARISKFLKIRGVATYRLYMFSDIVGEQMQFLDF